MNPYDDPDAVFIEEVSGVVFLVEFITGKVTWSVRIKQTYHDDKSSLDVVNATEVGTERILTGAEWDRLLERAGLVVEFEGHVIHEFLLLLGGGRAVEA